MDVGVDEPGKEDVTPRLTRLRPRYEPIPAIVPPATATSPSRTSPEKTLRCRPPVKTRSAGSSPRATRMIRSSPMPEVSEVQSGGSRRLWARWKGIYCRLFPACGRQASACSPHLYPPRQGEEGMRRERRSSIGLEKAGQ